MNVHQTMQQFFGRCLMLWVGCLVCETGLRAQLSWERVPGPPGGALLFKAATNYEGGLLVGSHKAGYIFDASGGKWRGLPGFIAANFSSMVMSASGSLVATLDNAVYRSVDSAHSWEPVVSEWLGSLHYERPGQIYGVPDQASAGVIRSTDAGLNWDIMRNGLESVERIRSLGVNQEGRIILLGTRGEILSWDKISARWRLIGNQPGAKTVGFDGQGKLLLLVNNTVGEFDIDLGSYTAYAHEFALLDHHNVGFIQNAGGDVFLAAQHSFIYKLSSASGTWHTYDISCSVDFTIYHALPVDNTRLVLATHRGAYLFNCLDGTVESLNSGLTEIGIQHFAVTARNTLLASIDRNIYRLPDTAAEWETSAKNIAAPSSSQAFRGFSSASHDTLYALGNAHLYRSVDDAAHWQAIAPLPEKDARLLLHSREGRMYFAADSSLLVFNTQSGQWQKLPAQPGVSMTEDRQGRLFRSTIHDLVMISTDRGASWEPGKAPVTGTLALKLRYSPFADLLAFNQLGAFRSRDGAASWRSVFEGSVRELIVLDRSRLVLLSFAAILYSTDFGASFQIIHRGLPPLPDYSRAQLVYAGSRLYFNTANDGLYRSSSSPSALETGDLTPGVASLHLNVHPQPAADKLAVSYILPDPGRVELVVYDASGRLVERQRSKLLPAGSHESQWDCRSAVDGVYFIQLSSNGLVLALVPATIRK